MNKRNILSAILLLLTLNIGFSSVIISSPKTGVIFNPSDTILLKGVTDENSIVTLKYINPLKKITEIGSAVPNSEGFWEMNIPLSNFEGGRYTITAETPTHKTGMDFTVLSEIQIDFSIDKLKYERGSYLRLNAVTNENIYSLYANLITPKNETMTLLLEKNNDGVLEVLYKIPESAPLGYYSAKINYSSDIYFGKSEIKYFEVMPTRFDFFFVKGNTFLLGKNLIFIEAKYRNGEPVVKSNLFAEIVSPSTKTYFVNLSKMHDGLYMVEFELNESGVWTLVFDEREYENVGKMSLLISVSSEKAIEMSAKIDSNFITGNVMYSSGEPAVSNVEIYIDGNWVSTVNTDSNGAFSYEYKAMKDSSYIFLFSKLSSSIAQKFLFVSPKEIAVKDKSVDLESAILSRIEAGKNKTEILIIRNNNNVETRVNFGKVNFPDWVILPEAITLGPLEEKQIKVAFNVPYAVQAGQFIGKITAMTDNSIEEENMVLVLLKETESLLCEPDIVYKERNVLVEKDCTNECASLITGEAVNIGGGKIDKVIAATISISALIVLFVMRNEFYERMKGEGTLKIKINRKTKEEKS